jgi:hypothetical protein
VSMDAAIKLKAAAVERWMLASTATTISVVITKRGMKTPAASLSQSVVGGKKVQRLSTRDTAED